MMVKGLRDPVTDAQCIASLWELKSICIGALSVYSVESQRFLFEHFVERQVRFVAFQDYVKGLLSGKCDIVPSPSSQLLEKLKSVVDSGAWELQDWSGRRVSSKLSKTITAPIEFHLKRFCIPSDMPSKEANHETKQLLSQILEIYFCEVDMYGIAASRLPRDSDPVT